MYSSIRSPYGYFHFFFFLLSVCIVIVVHCNTKNLFVLSLFLFFIISLNNSALKHSDLYCNFGCIHSNRQHHTSYIKHFSLELSVLCENKLFSGSKSLSIYMTRFSSPVTKDVSLWCKLPLQEPKRQNAFLQIPCIAADDIITHLPSFLLITSKEPANLIHETRSLLLASQPWGACSCHSGCWSSEPGSSICTACQRPSQYSPVSTLRTPQQASR